MNFEDRNGMPRMAPTWSSIESPFHRRKGRYLCTEVAGHAIRHATADRVAGHIDAVSIHAIILFEIADQIASELHIVGIARWPIGTDTGIPRSWIVFPLWIHKDKVGLVGLNRHI